MLRHIFRRPATKVTNKFVGGSLISLGLGSSLYAGQQLKLATQTPAYAFWGNSNANDKVSSSQSPSLGSSQDAGAIAVQKNMTHLERSIYNHTHNPDGTPIPSNVAMTVSDRVMIECNVPKMVHGTGVTVHDVRRCLSQYTDIELRDALQTGIIRDYIMKAIQDTQLSLLSAQTEMTLGSLQSLIKGMTTHSVIPVKKGVIDEIQICQYKANDNLEDTYSIHTNLHSDPGAIVGVYDGHSGQDASHYCAKNLAPYLDFFNYYDLSPTLMDPSVIQIADDHYIDMADGENRYKALTGACLLMTHFTPTQLKTLWSGDCRAMVIRGPDSTANLVTPNNNNNSPRSHHVTSSDMANPPIVHHTLPLNGAVPTPGSITGSWAELTLPHQIDLNYYEKERLISQHPTEKDIIARDRVKGGLQPTRAFGDAHYKKLSYFKLKYPNKSLENWHPPYITATPDSSIYKFNTNDRYVILSSDGLFEDLSPIAINSLVNAYPDLSEPFRVAMGGKDNIAGFLTIQALLTAGRRVLGHGANHTELAEFLSLLPPGKQRRRVHDDITVIVVKLNEPGIDKVLSDVKTGKPPVPVNLREAIKRGLLSDKSYTGEFLNTGIPVDRHDVRIYPGPSKEQTWNE